MYISHEKLYTQADSSPCWRHFFKWRERGRERERERWWVCMNLCMWVSEWVRERQCVCVCVCVCVYVRERERERERAGTCAWICLPASMHTGTRVKLNVCWTKRLFEKLSLKYPSSLCHRSQWHQWVSNCTPTSHMSNHMFVSIPTSSTLFARLVMLLFCVIQTVRSLLSSLLPWPHHAYQSQLNCGTGHPGAYQPSHTV